MRQINCDVFERMKMPGAGWKQRLDVPIFSSQGALVTMIRWVWKKQSASTGHTERNASFRNSQKVCRLYWKQLKKHADRRQKCFGGLLMGDDILVFQNVTVTSDITVMSAMLVYNVHLHFNMHALLNSCFHSKHYSKQTNIHMLLRTCLTNWN